MQRRPVPRLNLALLLFGLLMIALAAVFFYAGMPADLRMANLCLGIGLGVNTTVAVMQAAEAKRS